MPYPEWENRKNLIGEVTRVVINAVDPHAAVLQTLSLSSGIMRAGGKQYQIDQLGKIYLVGFGKAVVKMAVAVSDVMGDLIHSGFLISKYIDPIEAKKIPGCIEVGMGNHPIPGDESFQRTQELLFFLRQVKANDLVICLISGGGSALCTAPIPGISSDDLQEMTGLLLACGAEINEMNVIRKHVDVIKGGGLAEKIAPAYLLTLILSDVIGSPLDVIASGPTVPDETSFLHMDDCFRKYDLYEKMPSSISRHLKMGLSGAVKETPKPGDRCFENVANVLIASNYTACQAALRCVGAMGFHAQLLTTFLRGEAREAGRFLASILTQIERSGEPLPQPACLVLGGETTVTLCGQGLGGRNQEIALAAVRDLAGLDGVLLFTLATDGEDGPTKAAGAWVDGETLSKGLALGLTPESYLANNDAYHYFEALEQLVMTGPTGTNVNDCAFLLAYA